jgi:alkanesulfonate monooxygenase SsuD/methylene tetrahydromethanopterin reductase-like flavin-dependent oxidoreductase (luciferase family)
VRTVRTAAEQAGRDPASVRIWSCYATVHDGLPEALRLRKTVGRLATYLQGYGDLLVGTNGWDPQPLARFRADPVVAAVPGAIDGTADAATLEHIATLLPEPWLEPAATGSPERCADRVLRQFDRGVDGVIMHGSTPDELAPVVAAYQAVRPEHRFDGLAANPGR